MRICKLCFEILSLSVSKTNHARILVRVPLLPMHVVPVDQFLVQPDDLTEELDLLLAVLDLLVSEVLHRVLILDEFAPLEEGDRRVDDLHGRQH